MRKVLVIGASSGIGAALAHHLAKQGDHVWLAARRADKLESNVAQIRAAGGTAEAVSLDIADADGMEQALTALDTRAGGFDVVVANAAVGGRGATVSGLRYADVKNVLHVNFIGTVATLLAAQQPMLARGRGHLVVISSLAAELALPVAPDYGAAKAGLTFFAEAMRHDLQRRGIHVTLVHPGFVKSEMTAKNKFPMPFILETADAAALIARAIDRKAALLRFPLAYKILFTIAKLLPRSLVGRLALSQTKSGPQGMPRSE